MPSASDVLKAIDFSKVPALPAPPGVKADLSHSGEVPAGSKAFFATFVAVTTICLFIRLFVKVRIIKKLHAEDYFAIIGYIGFVGLVGIIIRTVQLGSGRHQWNVSAINGFHMSELSNIGEIVFSVAVLFGKLAILIQLKRIFIVHKTGGLYKYLNFLIFIHCLSMFIPVPALTFQCWPRERIWMPALVPGKCISRNGLVMAFAIIPSLVDWASLVVPIIGVKNLQMTRGRKWKIWLIFGVGLSACIASVARIGFTVHWITTADLTYHAQPVAWLAIAELSAILIIVCTPTMARFVEHIRGVTPSRNSMYHSNPSSGRSRLSGLRMSRLTLGGKKAETTVNVSKASKDSDGGSEAVDSLNPEPGTGDISEMPRLVVRERPKKEKMIKYNMALLLNRRGRGNCSASRSY